MDLNGLLNVYQAHHRNITTFALEIGLQMLFEVLTLTFRGLSSFETQCAGLLDFFDGRHVDFPV